MGGKGYKSYTSLTGKKVSGDWEDSDRGAGNKATRRAGGEVKAKSPTYIAHVINKGKKKVDPKKNPAVKEHHQTDANGKVIEHGDGTPSSVEEDYYRGTGEKVVARTKKWMDKKGQKGAPGLDAMKARTAEHKAKRGVKEDFIGEVKDVESTDTNGKKIDVMKGKNKIKINPNVGEQVEPNKKVDPSIEKKQQRVSMMKRQILQKKMQAVRSGGGADIVAHNQPKGEMVEAKVEQEDPRSMGTKYRNIKNKLRSMGVKFVGPASRLEEEDKAYQYVVSKLKKKYGDGVLTKGDKIKPPTAAQKKAAAAHRAKLAKQDHRDPTEKASDGRYSDRYSNRGSD